MSNFLVITQEIFDDLVTDYGPFFALAGCIHHWYMVDYTLDEQMKVAQLDENDPMKSDVSTFEPFTTKDELWHYISENSNTEIWINFQAEADELESKSPDSDISIIDIWGQKASAKSITINLQAVSDDLKGIFRAMVRLDKN